MKKFEKRFDNIKLLVARLSELTGLAARYTFVPRCAYEIGAFVVEKDGSLTVGDEADERFLETLISENMIGEERHVEEPSRTKKAKKASANTPTSVITPILGTEDWEDDDTGIRPMEPLQPSSKTKKKASRYSKRAENAKLSAAVGATATRHPRPGTLSGVNSGEDPYI